MDLQVKGDVAVVIGGAQGIGAAIAETAAEESMRVAVLDIHPDTQSLAAALGDRWGVATLGVSANVCDDGEMTAAATHVVESLGACDHLFYAAGAGSGKYGYPFWKLSSSDWPRVLDVNLVGAVRSLDAFHEQLQASPHGTALLLSSVAAQIGSQTDPPYSAAKAALLNFTQCAARDLAEYGVRVNAICPGMIRTALNRGVWQAWHDEQPESERQDYDTWAMEKISRISLLGRWQTPEDIAAAALFLASPRAGNITGQTVNVDGGQVM